MGPTSVEYDESPRPRVLLSGFTDDEPVGNLLDGLAPTSRDLTEVGLQILRAASWDAVVARGRPTDGWQGHRFLQFGGAPWPETIDRLKIELLPVWGDEVVLPSECPAEFRDEIKKSVIPVIRNTELPRRAILPPLVGMQVDYFIPLVTDADGNAFAAIYKPKNSAEEVVYLPTGVEPSRAWIALAFERWSESDPEAFPTAAHWTRHPEWMTADERAALEDVATAERNLSQATQRLEHELSEARRVLEDRHGEANASQRLLLSATGDELVHAVAVALREVGFEVEIRDESGGRQKFEDLRVRDEAWTAIGEVKGYGKGASTTDVMKLQRFSKEYQCEMSVFPDAQWYIVNQFRDRDPGTRPEILRGQDADVDAFADDDGLVIDTRTLFRLRKDVAEGSLAAEEARATLRAARGRLVYPEPQANS